MQHHPCVFVRDPYTFPDFIHTQKRHPKTDMRSPTAMWDFWSPSPESLHQVTILMSERGLPTDIRHINGQPEQSYGGAHQVDRKRSAERSVFDAVNAL